MAREQMMRAKTRAVESSWFGPLLGAGIGALVAKALQARAMDGRRMEWRRDWPEYGPGRSSSYPTRSSYPYRWTGMEDEPLWGEGEMAERHAATATAEDEGARGGLAGAAAGMAEKAGEAKERARAMTEHARERIQEASSGVRERLESTSSGIRERLPDREAIRESTHEDTGLWALGALALGALFGFALPVTQREREALAPARRKARELGQDLEERLLEKGSDALGKAKARVEGTEGERTPSSVEGTSPSIGASPSDDASSIH